MAARCVAIFGVWVQAMQQVNLYLPELRPQKDWFSAKYLSFVFVGIILILVVIYNVKSYEVNQLEQELEEKNLVLNALSTELDKTKGIKKPSSKQDIELSIAMLERKIKSRERLVDLIQGQTVGEDFSFYNAMSAMAKNSTSKVSLAKFTFSSGGKLIEMDGEGINSYDIPHYLGLLRKEEIFSKSKFGLINIGNIKVNGGVDFSMGYDGSSSFSTVVDK